MLSLRPLLAFLDTSELVLHLMPWLRVAMRRSGERALWVIGMRVESEATASGESEISSFVREVPNDRLRLMALTRFDDQTVRLYLAARLPDQEFTDDDVRQVSDFTRGLPLAVSLVGDLLCRGANLRDACAVVERPQGVLEPVSPGEVVRALARRFLIHAERQPGEQARRDLHRILCLAIANGNPTRNPSLLRALWGTTDDLFDALWDLASRHDFLSCRELSGFTTTCGTLCAMTWSTRCAAPESSRVASAQSTRSPSSCRSDVRCSLPVRPGDQ
ncbi:MAG: hypothetical protein IPL43_00225 [Micropruina sp.]|nr:hypothetical protein [Micropruina sp.]